MYGYIYKTTNLINDKIYIGQHKANQFEPDKYKGSGTMLQRAFKKYGKQNFKCELIKICNTKQELNKAEKYYVEAYDCRNNAKGYNISEGGWGGAHPAWNSGLNISDSRVAKYTISRNTHFKNQGSIGYCGLQGKDNKNSVETRIYDILPYFEEYWKTHFKKEIYEYFHIGPVCYDECIQRLGLNENNIERQQLLSDKHYKRWKEARKINGTDSKMGTKIKCVETGKIFNSIKEAQEYLGLNSVNSLYLALKYSDKKCRNYHWIRL